MYWAMRTVPPTARPLMRLMTRIVTWPPMETAAEPTAPQKRLTISISAMLYSAWSRLDSKNGSEKRISCPTTLPLVRSFWNLLNG